MASTADRISAVGQQRPAANDISFPMAASSEVYLNCFVNGDANGRVLNGTDAAAQRCLGVGAERKSNGVTAGATRALVRAGVILPFAINGVTIDGTDQGKNAIIFDNDTVTDAAAGVNDVVAGIIRRVEGGVAYVEVGTFSPTNA